mgnify:CR=1 FL=1|jgi:hypothetical protein
MITEKKERPENVAIVSVLDLFSHMSHGSIKLHVSHFKPETLTDGVFIPDDEQWLDSYVVYSKTEANLSIGCMISGMANGERTYIYKTLPVIRSGEYVNERLKLALPVQLADRLPVNTYENYEKLPDGFAMVDINLGTLPLMAECEKGVMIEEIIGTIGQLYHEDLILKHLESMFPSYHTSIPVYQLTNVEKSKPKKKTGVIFEFSIKEFPKVPTVRTREEIENSKATYVDEIFAAIGVDFNSSTDDIQTATYDRRRQLEDKLRQQIFSWIVDHKDSELPPKQSFLVSVYESKTQNKSFPITITTKTKRAKS